LTGPHKHTSQRDFRTQVLARRWLTGPHKHTSQRDFRTQVLARRWLTGPHKEIVTPTIRLRFNSNFTGLVRAPGF